MSPAWGEGRGGEPDIALLLQADQSLEGGVARIVTNLAGGFVDAGLRTDLVLTGRLGIRPHDLDDRIRVVELDASGLKSAFVPLVRYLGDARPRTVLSSMEHLNILAVWARGLVSVEPRLVLVTHGLISRRLESMWGWRERLFLPLLISIFYSRADVLVGVSKGVAAELREMVPHGTVHQIYNPVLSSSIERKIRMASRPAGLRADRPLVIGAGRFLELKDFSTLMRAFARVRSERKARLALVGDGPLRESLERLSHSLGIRDDVIFPGMVEDPFPWFKAAAVFVLSSRWEGFGNVIVEALACGTPVVSTNCPVGPGEILSDGRYGTLVPVGDPSSMAEAILETLEREAHPDVLRRRAAEFSVGARIADYRAVLKL